MQRTVLKRLLTAVAFAAATGSAYAAELTVSAATSLTNAFKEIAQSYQMQYPDAKIALNFGASGALCRIYSLACRAGDFA